MFCNKANQECHEMNCLHAGRHEKLDSCYSQICVEFGIQVNCIESTISDELVNPQEQILEKEKAELDRKKDEVIKLISDSIAIVDAAIKAIDDIKNIKES